MDVRVLKYFLTVAREESFSRAAQSLYMSQPTLSRQIREMEEELGVRLFARTSRSVRLTRDGMRLRKRAQEIVDLMDRTKEEFAPSEDGVVAGDVSIGGGESHLMRWIARVAIELKRRHPGVRYQLYSGNADDVAERLDRGLLDFGLLVDARDDDKYESLSLPGQDRWGLLTREEHPLARKEVIRRADLQDAPVLVSQQGMDSGALSRWVGERDLNVAATYNLLFNAAVMVEEGMGAALCLEHLVNVMETPGLRFRPLEPEVRVELKLVWKRYQMHSPAAEEFLRLAQATAQGRAYLP